MVSKALLCEPALLFVALQEREQELQKEEARQIKNFEMCQEFEQSASAFLQWIQETRYSVLSSNQDPPHTCCFKSGWQEEVLGTLSPSPYFDSALYLYLTTFTIPYCVHYPHPPFLFTSLIIHTSPPIVYTYTSKRQSCDCMPHYTL